MQYFKATLTVFLICLWSASLFAEKLYIWTDDAGVLNMTNNPGLAPDEMRSPKELAGLPLPKQAVLPPPVVRPPIIEGLNPPGDGQQRLEQALEGVEKRNQSIQNLQKLLQQVLGKKAKPTPTP